MEHTQKDFFISYNKADREWAQWIAWHLEAAGFTTLIGDWDFRPGANFVADMHTAISTTDRTIAILSPDYQASHYTKSEWTAAFAQDSTGNKKKLVPVRVRKCELGGLLAQIIYIDLVDKDENSAREALLAGINPDRDKPSVQPAFPGSFHPSFPGASPTSPPITYAQGAPWNDNDEESRPSSQAKAINNIDGSMESFKGSFSERISFQKEALISKHLTPPTTEVASKEVSAASQNLPAKSALESSSLQAATESRGLTNHIDLVLGYLDVLLGEIKYRTERETIRNTPSSLSVFVPLRAEYDNPDVDRRVLYAEVEMNERDLKALDYERRKKERQKYEKQFRYPKTGNGEPLFELLKTHPKVVLLGDPGSGKTTQLRYLASRLAEAIKANPQRLIQYLEEPGSNIVSAWTDPEVGPIRLPILIRIAELADALKNTPHLTILDYLLVFFKKLHVPKPKSTLKLFHSLLESGRCYILFDGLDEIIRHEDRQRIVESILNFSNSPNYSGNRFLVASRIVGYSPGLLGGNFDHYRICHLTDAQISEFLQKWYRELEKQKLPAVPLEEIDSSARHRTEEILRDIRTTPGVSRLATNPLLLRILAVVNREKGDLPKHRVGIYEMAAFTLLRDWNQLRGAARPPVTDEESLALLCPLAYYIHTNNQSQLLEEDTVRELLKSVLVNDPASFPPDLRPDIYIKDFLNWVRKDTGLFVERGVGLYGFMHLTFEEYFTARHIVKVADKNFQEIFERLHQPRWREPILLAVGHIDQHHGDKVTEVLRKILDAGSDYEHDLCRDLLLAAACASDSANVESELIEEIAQRLFSVYCDRHRSVRYLPLQNQIKNGLLTLKHGQGERGAEITERLLAARLSDHSDRQASLRALEAADWLEPRSMAVADALAQCTHLGTRPRELWLKMTAASDASADWEPYRTKPALPLLLGAIWLYGWRDIIEQLLNLPEETLAQLSTEALYLLRDDFSQHCELLNEELTAPHRARADRVGEILIELRSLAQGMARCAETAPKWRWFGWVADSMTAYFDDVLSLGKMNEEGLHLVREDFNRNVRLFAGLRSGRSQEFADLFEKLQQWGKTIALNAQGCATLAPYLNEAAYGCNLSNDRQEFKNDLQAIQRELALELMTLLQSTDDYETYNQAALFLALTGDPEITSQLVSLVLTDVSQFTSPRSAWAMQLLTTPLFHKRVHFTEEQNQLLTLWLKDETGKAKLAAGILWAKSGLTREQLSWCWSILKTPGIPLAYEMEEELNSVTVIQGTADFLALLEMGLKDEILRPTALELMRKVAWNGLETFKSALNWLVGDDQEVRHLAALLLAQQRESILIPRIEFVSSCHEKFPQQLPPESRSSRIDRPNNIPSNLDLCWRIVSSTRDDRQWYEYLSYLSSLESQQSRVAEALSTALRSDSDQRRISAVALLFERTGLCLNVLAELIGWISQTTIVAEEALRGLGAIMQLESVPPEAISWLRSLLDSDSRHPIARWLHITLTPHRLSVDAPLSALADHLGSREPDLRLASALLLLMADIPRVLVAALVEAAQSSNDCTRHAATNAIYEIAQVLPTNGSTDAVQALADFLAKSTVEKVGDLGTRSVTAMHYVPHRDPYWIARWLEQARSGNETQKETAAEMLTAWLNVGDAALNLLCQTMSDEQQPTELRLLAIQSLSSSLATHSQVRTKAVSRSALLTCLSDQNKKMRQYAAFALQWVQGDDNLLFNELMARAQSDPDIGVKVTSLRSIGCLLNRLPITISDERLDLIRAFLSSQAKALRRAAACALARAYRGRKDRPELLFAELKSNDDLLTSMIDATIDWDDWKYDELLPDAGPHCLDIRQIADWLNLQPNDEHKRHIEIIIKDLQGEVKLSQSPFKKSAKPEPYKIFYSSWRRRQVLTAVLSKDSDLNTFYNFIPGPADPEELPATRYRRLEPVIKMFSTLAKDPNSWLTRMYAIKALGNCQQFSGEVAEAFFLACRDVTDVSRATVGAVSNFNFFTPNSLVHLIQAISGESLIAASNAARLLGQLGLHRSDEIAHERNNLADKLAVLLHAPLSRRIIHDMGNNGITYRIGPLYDEIYKALEQLVAGEDAPPPPPPRANERANGASTERALPEFLGLNDLSQMSDGELLESLETLKRENLNWEATTGSAKKWWEAFESENSNRMRLVVALAEELVMRGATIYDFFMAYVYSTAENIQANLHYLDFVRIKKHQHDTYFHPEINSFQTALSELDDDGRTVDENLTSLLEPVLERMKRELGWETNDPIVNGLIQEWWGSLESQYADKRVLLLLLNELKSRKEQQRHSYKYQGVGQDLTIKDFYDACVYSETESLQANLHYLDYLILKQREKKLKEGNDEPLEGETSPLIRNKLVVDEISHIGLSYYHELKGKWRRDMAEGSSSDPASSTIAVDEMPEKAPFERCSSCRTLLPLTTAKCKMCGAVLHDTPQSDELAANIAERDEMCEKLFQAEIDSCCYGLTEYRGEISDGLVYRVIDEVLTQPLADAIKYQVIFDILDVSSRLSKAAKYLVDERDIAFELLDRISNISSNRVSLPQNRAAEGSLIDASQPPDSQSLPDPEACPLTNDELFVIAQVVDQLEQSYGGAIDFINRKWNRNIASPQGNIAENVSEEMTK